VKSETNSHFSGYRNIGLETSFKKDNNKEQLSLGQGSRKTQFIVIFSSPPYIRLLSHLLNIFISTRNSPEGP
jgi:hypothetical protein